MFIRTAKKDDLNAIAAVETECFPAAEAATKEEFEEFLDELESYYKEYEKENA